MEIDRRSLLQGTLAVAMTGGSGSAKAAPAGALDEALEKLARTGPEYRGGLANHGPMAAEALVTLGREGEIGAWVERYRRRLDPSPAVGTPVDASAWRESLGGFGRFPAWHALLSWSVVTNPSRSVPGLAFTVPLGLLPPSCVLSTAISCHPSASRTTPYRSASHRPWPHSTSTIQTHPATPPEHPATPASNPSITTTRHHQTHHTTRACNSPQKTPHNSSTPNNAGLSWATPTTQPDTAHTTQPHALKSLTCSVTFDPRSLPAHTYTEAPFPDQPAAAARPHTNRTFHHHSTGLTVPKSPGHRPSQLSHTRAARGPGTI